MNNNRVKSQRLTEEDLQRIKNLPPKQAAEEMKMAFHYLHAEVDGILHSNVLTDQKIQSFISEHGSVQVYIIAAICAIFIPALLISPFASYMSQFVFTGILLLLAALIFTSAFIFEKKRAKNMKSFACEHWQRASLFQSEFIKVFCVLGRRSNSYYIKFLDDTGKKRKFEINKDEYKRIKALQLAKGSSVYVVKYPLPHNKWGYAAFEAHGFKNETTIFNI